MSTPPPSVGRIVHYVPEGEPQCLAAIVTATDYGLASLFVISERSTGYLLDVEASDAPEANTWHWPERVE